MVGIPDITNTLLTNVPITQYMADPSWIVQAALDLAAAAGQTPNSQSSTSPVRATYSTAGVATSGAVNFTTGYWDTLVKIDETFINAQKIAWTEEPNIEKHVAPGRDGDVLHHLGWHSRTVKIDATISGTYTGTLIQTLQKKTKTKTPVQLTVATIMDQCISGSYIIDSFAPSSSVKYPINTSDYTISLLSTGGTTPTATNTNLNPAQQRSSNSYTNNAQEGLTWVRSGLNGQPLASTPMMQSVVNMLNKAGVNTGGALEDYKIVNSQMPTDNFTEWYQSTLGSSDHIVIQHYGQGIVAYNPKNQRIGFLTWPTIQAGIPSHAVDPANFDTGWHYMQSNPSGQVTMHNISGWEVNPSSWQV